MQPDPHPFASASRRHNPHNRSVLMEHGAWIALLLPRNSPDYAQRCAAGCLSLQLWNCQEHLSILAPSLETGFTYELFPLDDEVIRLGCYQSVTSLLNEYEISTMPRRIVADLYDRFVLSSLIGASAPRPTRRRPAIAPPLG
jgi:hypothetical protein